jgi:hypothetical protein
MVSYRSLRPPTDRHTSPRSKARQRIAPEVARLQREAPDGEGRAARSGLPVAPTKLEQIEALVRAGRVADPLAGIVAPAPAKDPHPDPRPFRRREKEESGERVRAERVAASEQAAASAPQNGDGERASPQPGLLPSLLQRTQYLYEKTIVPVRKIAQLIGVSERTIYKYAKRYNWARRYVRPARTRGTGGRFITCEESAQAAQASHGPFACGPKALDPLAAEAAAARCERAAAASNLAVSEIMAAGTIEDAQRRAAEYGETARRMLGDMARMLRGLARTAIEQAAREADDTVERARLAAAQAEAERRTAELRLELAARLDAAIAGEKDEERRAAEAARSRAENEALAERVRNDATRGPRIRGFG